MIAPVQRIPRYILLLEDMLKNTWHEHPDYMVISCCVSSERPTLLKNLKSACEIVQTMASQVNSSITQMERMHRVMQIQDRIQGLPQVAFAKLQL